MLSNLSVKKKILLAISTVLIILSSLSIYNYFEINKLNKEIVHLMSVSVEAEINLKDWKSAIEKNLVRGRILALIENNKVEEELKSAMKETSKSVNELQVLVEKSLESNTKELKQLFAEVSEVRQTYSQARADFFKRKDAGSIPSEELEKEFNKVVQVNSALYLDKVNALIEAEKKTIVKEQEQIFANLQFFQTSMIASSITALIVGVLFSLVIANKIIVPVKDAISFANNIADGNLTSDITNESKDEIGQLVQTLKNMNSSLRNIVIDVRNGSNELFTSSSEISAGNMDLSQRTEAVASALQQAAASVEEFTQTIHQTSENANYATKISEEAFSTAEVSGKDMKNFITTMQNINKSSEKIGEIISVIDSIAFQTNILALNAAVEAARAGEHGRGFAVVASEVRILSKRSADAAKEIKQLIHDSQEKVNEGTNAVNIASQNIEQLVTKIKNVSAVIGEINTSTKEQTIGIKQINEVIAHIDDSTQKNAALVEESTAATESMKNQANLLNDLVTRFNV